MLRLVGPVDIGDAIPRTLFPQIDPLLVMVFP